MSAGTISISENNITSSSSSNININAGVDANGTLIINATDVSFNLLGEISLYNNNGYYGSFNTISIQTDPFLNITGPNVNVESSNTEGRIWISNNMLANATTTSFLQWNYEPDAITSTYTGGYLSIYNSPTSSQRYKENIISLSEDRYNTETFEKLRPVQFNYINDEEKIKKIGFIAEEFDELNLNELVVYNKEGQPESIHYENTTSFIVKIVQEQQKQIKSQQLEIDGLKEDIKNLTSLVQGLLSSKP